MELQTKFLHIKTQSSEDLLVLGVFPVNPKDIPESPFEEFVFAMFPAKVSFKPKSFSLNDWAPLSKAKLFKIPMFAIMNADSPTDEASNEYAMFLISKNVDAAAIKTVIEDQFGSSIIGNKQKFEARTLH